MSGGKPRSKVFRASKLFVCRHCRQRIVLGAKYLRFWQKGSPRRVICMADALGARDERGVRLYDCEALQDYVASLVDGARSTHWRTYLEAAYEGIQVEIALNGAAWTAADVTMLKLMRECVLRHATK